LRLIIDNTVAVILDRADLLPGDNTMLDAVNRLGAEWTEAALRCSTQDCNAEETAHLYCRMPAGADSPAFFIALSGPPNRLQDAILVENTS
jgi:hypothetical protein